MEREYWFMSYETVWPDGSRDLGSTVIREHPLAWERDIRNNSVRFGMLPTLISWHKLTPEDVAAANKAGIIHD